MCIVRKVVMGRAHGKVNWLGCREREEAVVPIRREIWKAGKVF